MYTLREYVHLLRVVLCTLVDTDMFPKQTGKLLYVFATAKVTERHVRSVNNQIPEFIFSMMLVFNNYVRLKDFSEPSAQVPFYPWRKRWMLMCSHRISSDTLFHLSSACLPRLVLPWLGLQIGFHWGSIIFCVVMCFCTRPPTTPPPTHMLLLSLYVPQFSSCLYLCQLSYPPEGWHFSRPCYCKTSPSSSDYVTKGEIFLTLSATMWAF